MSNGETCSVGVIVAEAIEGTDRMIKRARKIVLRRPLFLLKVAREGHDFRTDAPIIGPGLIDLFPVGLCWPWNRVIQC